LRQFLQDIATASEQGDFRAPLGQSDRRGQSDPRRSARDNEDVILDLHPSILLFQCEQYPSINGQLSLAPQKCHGPQFLDSAFVQDRRSAPAQSGAKPAVFV
jgi:hypothetical protein